MGGKKGGGGKAKATAEPVEKKSKKAGGGWKAELAAEEEAKKAEAARLLAIKNHFKFVIARHILMEDEDEAKQLFEKITEEYGTSIPPDAFSEFAKKYSSCPSVQGSKPGRLAPFARGKMEEEFEKAAFETEPV